MNTRKKNWLFAVCLLIPMLAFFAGYLFNHNPDYEPTGLIMDDNALYVAYAKQYLDADHLQIFYSNPFNDSEAYPAIYFQTQSVILALMMKTGIAAGFTMMVFVILFSLLCFRLVIAIHDTLLPENKYRTITIIIFAWGGGLLALSGIPVHFLRPADGQDFFDRIFFLDPGWGWWGLNLGRSLFIGCEAYYHFLFLAIVLLILRKKWKAALAVMFILSVSHPFTGIELLSILCAWLALEKLWMKNNTIPWYFAIGTVIIISFHLFYYLYYLNQFADHLSVSDQFSVNWRLRFFSMIPAYAIVAPLAALAIAKLNKPRAFFQNPHNRLFLCWLIVVLLLVNHELFMKPRQPIHFTRGYDWMGFFLLGISAIPWLFDFFKKIRYGMLASILFVTLFLSDNFLWIVNYIRFGDKTKSVMYISPEQKEILTIINQNTDSKTLVISGDLDLSLFTTVYSKAYTLISNPYTTPFYSRKKQVFDQFVKFGKADSTWAGRKILLLLRTTDSTENNLASALQRARMIKQTDNYLLMRVDSAGER